MLISSGVLLLAHFPKTADILQRDQPNDIQVKNLLFRSKFHISSLGRKRSLNYDLVTGPFADENAKHLNICI